MCVEISGCRFSVDREDKARWGTFDEKIKKWDGSMARLNRVCSFPLNLQFDQIFGLYELAEEGVELI